ncbi:MAG: peptide ABC transporter [Acidimicrobiales bacterium]|nr:MAG: peptide ABC transporter [Acidimicrobiales bacterium]
MTISKRLLQLVAVVLAVTFLSFLMLNLLPGGPEVSICATAASEKCFEEVRSDLGLDKPLPVRYLQWLGNALTGDLGESAIRPEPVWQAITQRLPVTLELLVYSQFLALAVAIPAGVYAAHRAGGLFDRISTTVAFALLSAPNFVVAIVLILIFAVQLKIFRVQGYTNLTADLPGSIFTNLKDFFLPSLTLAVAEMAVYLRLLRNDMIATLQEDYITMAKAKGLPDGTILLRHALRPSTFSLVTVAGLNMGRLIGGALVVEVIFGLNGLGQYLVEAIFRRDYIPVQGTVVVIAVGYVLINFLVDMLYSVLDPRIGHGRAIA